MLVELGDEYRQFSFLCQHCAFPESIDLSLSTEEKHEEKLRENCVSWPRQCWVYGTASTWM